MCLASAVQRGRGSPRQQLRLQLLRLVARAFPPVHTVWDRTVPPRSIVLIRPDHVGDVLFTVPALRHLRESWPAARLTLCVGPWSQAVAEGIPYLDEIITCPFPWFSRKPRRWLFEPYWLLWQEARRIRAFEFDLSIVLRFDHWWGAWLAHLADIPRRAGYALPEVTPFLTDAVRYLPGRHEVVQNLALVETLTGGTVDPDTQSLSFQPAAADIAALAARLAENGIREGERIACVHPGTGAPVKLWHNEGWAAIVDTLVRAYELRVVVTGGPAEVELVRDLVSRVSVPVIDLAGQTNLGQLAALMARCRLVAGVDSGPLHLAVAVGTPTVHLFGPIDPAMFGPWGDPSRHLVIKSDRPCVPCNRLDYTANELDAHPCMRDINVGQVLVAIGRLLQSNP